MRVCTLDPLSLKDVTDLNSAPFVIEGKGGTTVTIYFESERNKEEYLSIEAHGSCATPEIKGVYDGIADNPDTGTINFGGVS
jgi:hypothetical protein